MANRVTPDQLVSKIVIDSENQKVGTIVDIEREKLPKITIDYLVIEFDRRLNIGLKKTVNIRTRDAKLLPDGKIQVNYTKAELKRMSKEEELRRHPPKV
ncbi:MAG: hypothetical protein GF308_04300 [Candidatus Heimdallarchaeota archaeon]|nr:hypothetical protein [Candidatus Heimdallarchaeota archaeon]